MPAGAAEKATRAPYHNEILRLAEILGTVHYLRNLCESGDGDMWRKKMFALIRAEKPDIVQKRRLIARFNSGYRTLSQVYRICTPTAVDIANRYLDEGALLAGDIVQRYGQ